MALQAEEAEYRRELEEKLPAISKGLEDLQAAQVPVVPCHSELDRAEIRYDASYTLRHYLDSAASILTSAPTVETPSMQISSMEYDPENIELIPNSDHLSDYLSFKTALSRLSPPALLASAVQPTVTTNVSTIADILSEQQIADSPAIVTDSPLQEKLQFNAWIQVPGIKRVKVDMRFGDTVGDLRIRAKQAMSTAGIDFRKYFISYKCEMLADKGSIDPFICTTTPTFLASATSWCHGRVAANRAYF